MFKRGYWLYALVAMLCVAHYLIGFYAPKAPSPYVFSPLVTFLLTVSITVPFYLAWFAGTYAGLALRTAVVTMREQEDKIAFTRIAIGVFALTAGLVVTSMVSSVRPYYVGDAEVTAFITILTNYLYILGPLVGFLYISSGAAHLRRPMTGAGLSMLWVALGGILLAAYGAGYLWLIFTNPNRQIGDELAQATYYLPDAMIVTTIVIPFFASLLLSLVSIYRLAQYYRGVNGLIYKRSTMNFIVGMLFVIGGSNLLQTLLSLGTSRLEDLGLGALLVIIYVFLGLTTFGYLYLAFGARKLATIERVMQKYETKGA